MGRVCINDHRPEHSLGDPRWRNQCAQCEIERLTAEVERLSAALAPREEARAICSKMTPRQLEYLQLACKGYRREEIAQMLGVSYETARTMTDHARLRIGAGCRVEAAVILTKAGLL